MPSFSWVLCHLLLYVSLCFKCPEKQTTQTAQIAKVLTPQKCSPHKDVYTLAPGDKGSLLLHFHPILSHLLTLGAQLVGKRGARDNRPDSFCRVLSVPFF